MFNFCEKLAEIKLPDKLEDIGYCAFHNCKSLKDLTLPASVTSIERFAFSGCPCEERLKQERPELFKDESELFKEE